MRKQRKEKLLDNTISKLLEYFKHIVRDLLTYVLSGIVVILNFAYVIYHLDKVEFKILFDNNYTVWIVIIFAYVIGQIVMGFMYVFIELPKIDYIINKCFDIDINQKKEIKIYTKDRNLYEFFIERQNQLYYLRWNLAGAFFLNFLINIYLLFTYKEPLFSYLAYVSMFSFVLLLILHYRTAKDYTKTIKNIKRQLKL